MRNGAALGCVIAVLLGGQAARADHCGGQQSSEELSACLREHLRAPPPPIGNPPAHRIIITDPTAVVPPMLERDSPALIPRENLLRERIGQ